MEPGKPTSVDSMMASTSHEETLDCDAFEHLACPVDGSELKREGAWLVSDSGRRYPVVDGVAVLLRDDVPETIGLARQSLDLARRWADGDQSDPYFIETLGVSPEQRQQVREAFSTYDGTGVDPAISYLVAATNGILYKGLVGQLNAVPIPDIRLGPGHGSQLLDIGCSWGRWSTAAAAQGYRPIGIDPSVGAVLAARRRARHFGIDFRGVVGDARYLPFQKGSVDTAFSYSVLQHFSKADAVNAFGEIARVVAPGGTVRIQMASATGIRSIQHMARRGFRKPHAFEVRYWSPAQLSRAFRDAFGDARLEVDCYFGLGLQPSDRPLYGLGGRLILSLSEAIRNASRVIPPLRYVADSVYLVAKNTPEITRESGI